MKEFTLVFEMTITGTMSVRAEDKEAAEKIADQLEKTISVDDLNITDSDCECTDLWEKK